MKCTLSSSFISSFVLFFVVSWMKRRETEGNTRSPFTACFPSFHFSSFHSIHHTITPDKLNEEWTKEDNEERTQVSEVSAWFLFISSFRSSLHCWLCALFFFLSLMLQFTRLFRFACNWSMNKERRRTKDTTSDTILLPVVLSVALSFVFLSLQWFVRKHEIMWKERETQSTNEEKTPRSLSLTFSLLFTSFFLSSHSLWLMIPWWWGLVCVVCCVPFGCNGMEWSTNRTEHTTRHNPNPELVCQVQKSQF